MNNDILRDNNHAVLSGIAASNLRFSHTVWGENFYIFDLRVPRDSGTDDYIPITVSEKIYNVNKDLIGKSYGITGQFRSYNCHDDENHGRLLLSVLANDIKEIEDDFSAINQIDLTGFVCKLPVYRKTPLGREIADILLAVNRPYGKTDYIPCICWGRNAKYAESIEVGNLCRLTGRIQSRKYQKRIDDERAEERIAYEVSISRLEVVRNAE